MIRGCLYVLATTSLLGLGEANASRGLYPGATAKLVDSPMGTLPDSTIKAFCNSDRVVVGEISSVNGFYETYGESKYIMSHVTLDVTQSLRGETRSSLHLVLSGGRIGSDVRAPQNGLMAPILGVRYAIAYSLNPKKDSHLNKDDPLIAAHIYINTDKDVTAFYEKFLGTYCE